MEKVSKMFLLLGFLLLVSCAKEEALVPVVFPAKVEVTTGSELPRFLIEKDHEKKGVYREVEFIGFDEYRMDYFEDGCFLESVKGKYYSYDIDYKSEEVVFMGRVYLVK